MIWPLQIWKYVEGPPSAIIIRQLTGRNDKTREDSWLVAEFQSSNLPNMMREWRSLRHGAEAITAIQYLRRSLWPLNADEEKQRNKQTQHSNLETPRVMFATRDYCTYGSETYWTPEGTRLFGRPGRTWHCNEEGEMAVSCENCNEPPSSIKCGKFFVLHGVGCLIDWLVGWLVPISQVSSVNNKT